MSTIKITLTKEARQNAVTSLNRKGSAIPNDFEGPVFKDAYLTWCDNGGVSVTTYAGTIYFYPEATLARVAIYKED